jgi:hypothetical protein
MMGCALRKLFVHLTGEDILREQGRLLFALLDAFARSGYTILLFDNHPAEALGKYGALAPALDAVTRTQTLPANASEWILLHDKSDQAIDRLPWQRQLRVRFDLHAPYWFSDPLILPFPLHPAQAATPQTTLAAHRARPRTMRIFFSGDSEGYTRSRVNYPRPKLPRQKIIQIALQGLGDAVLLLRDAAMLGGPDRDYLNQCVIADPGKVWIDAGDWFATLAQADFFLSPPGIVMPMCHNLVEAMAVGTIPITNYPEWFVPPLQDGHNCIVFNDRDDLIAKLRLAMTLPATEIARMKLNAIDYYERQLRPEHFVRAIEARTDPALTLLLYTERNVAQHAARFGRHSVLYRHPATAGKPGWQRLLRAVFSPSRLAA